MAKKNLVIVESPAKAKTIASYLGSEFEVKSSLGHLRDLPSKGLGVNIAKRFEPTYEVAVDKADTAQQLKKAAKGKEVWLATDEDREGEAIAWHLCELLGLNPSEAKRIVFHEITKPAIQAAVAKPRRVDMNLVNSQQARRILDRLVGYELSPVLWKKIRRGLSAGRVQSVAVRLLVEREQAIRNHQPQPSFRVLAKFGSGDTNFPAELNKRPDSLDDAKEFMLAAKDARFEVKSVSQKPGSRNPSAPFTTSTLQQIASRQLGYGVRQTMRLAQKLYEAGHITYMRTDSTNLSELAISSAKDYITKQFGDDYLQIRKYQTKNQSAQEAHEAIRPTDLSRPEAGDDAQTRKLYKLIWQRTIASQMTAARIEFSEINVAISNRPELFVAKGQTLVFDGFLRVYPAGKDDVILPKLSEGQELQPESITATEIFSRAPSRYSEAALVKKLEELGIGRPSTYAPTISTIQDRGYVERKDLEGELKESRVLSLVAGKIDESTQEVRVGADRNKLIPTELAEIVTDFLVKNFGRVMDYDFTAHAETELDEVAEGKIAWQAMLEEFYKDFHPMVEKSESIKREDAAGARELGRDPQSGEIITARFGRFGPVLQMGEGGKEVETKPRFAPLPAGARLEDVTLEQAIPMFRLPRVVGQTADGEEIIADIGRFGPYVKVGKAYASIKDYDPFTITEAEAKTVLKEHAEAQAKKVIADFGEIRILNGPYGPYVTNGKVNARIPKDVEPQSIDEATAKKMIAEAPAKKRRRRK